MTAEPAADSARSGAAPRTGPGAGWGTPANLAIAAATALALALRVYRVALPGLLSVTQYDDGPYFGSAVRLIHGVLPYQGFAFVQPPGVTVLMTPAALLSTVTGTAWGLVAGRLLTAAAGAAGVLLLGLLIRRRGLIAVLVGCGLLAVVPPSVASAHTVMLEPWLVLFCLAGAVAVFDGDRLTASARRLAWGGAAFGFAGATKTWAIVPVVVILALSLPRIRQALIFAAGVAAAFLVTIAPFALAAPAQFFNSIVVAQLSRNGAPVPVGARVQYMVGFGGSRALGPAGVLAALAALVALVGAAYLVPALAARRMPPALDVFAMTTALLIIGMFLWPPFFAVHYAAYLDPFLAAAIALPLARLAASGGWRTAGPGALRKVAWSAAACLLVVTFVRAAQTTPAPKHGLSAAGIRRLVPAHACVASDDVSYLLLANRFVSNVPGCPQQVDGLGVDLALSRGLDPSTGAGKVPAVAAAWRGIFSHAQYLVLSSKNTLRVAWTPSLRAYFQSHFTLLARRRSYSVYKRV